MGILWNLSSESETLRILDEYLRKLEHSSRCPEEHPVAIISDRQLQMVSFPMDEHIKSCASQMNGALHTQTNMLGHMEVSWNEVEITAGFAGAIGNQI